MRRLALLIASLAVLGAGSRAPTTQARPAPEARPALDEMLEEWRGACDHLAGDALQDCLKG